MPPLRVCFISHLWAEGGAQLSLVELIGSLTLRGVECRVVLPHGGNPPEGLSARGISYVMHEYSAWASEARLPVWDRVLTRPATHVLRAITLARLIRGWQSDVVVTNTITICEGALAAFILRIPHVTHAREFGDLDHGLHFEYGPRLSVRILSALSDRVVFNSAALALHYSRQVPRTRARVIHNAVSLPPASETVHDDASTQKEKTSFRCVLVGWLLPGKGHGDAIRAIAELVRRGVSVKLTLVGGGGSSAYRRSLRSLIDELGIGAYVDMVGHTTDPWRFFHAADVALVCSRMEAFGRVTVEAMKLGKPVVGSRSGGTPEIIRNGFNGLLYTPGDAGELADKIEVLARDPQGTREMGERAKQFAMETFNLDRHATEFMELLQEVSGGRPPDAKSDRSRLAARP